MTSPSRQRAADRFRAVGLDEEAALALAALAHPFDGPTGAPPSQVRATVQAEADAFRTASAGIDDAETLLWLGTTVADRYVTSASSGGASDLAAEFRGVREAMDLGIARARKGPLIPPVGPVSPGQDAPTLAWPTSSGDARGGPPPPPAEAGALPPPAWPGQTVQHTGAAPSSDRRNWVVALLVGIPLVLLVAGFSLVLSRATDTVDDAVVAVPGPDGVDPGGRAGPEDPTVPDVPPEPIFPEVPDLDAPDPALFVEALDPITRSEAAMVAWQAEAFAWSQEGDVAVPDDEVVTQAERAIEQVRATQQALDALALGERDAASTGDLPDVLDAYRAHQDAWVGVWEAAIEEPATAYDEAAAPADLFADVNDTANDFGPRFAGVVPPGLDQPQAEAVLTILSGFQPQFDPEEVLGLDDGPTV